MQRPSGFQVMAGAALGLSVAASIATGWDGAPTDYETFCLFVATTTAFWAAVASKKIPAGKFPTLARYRRRFIIG